MQELRSTDILDKEIQADARKKAERMLAKTDSECEKLIASVESDIEKVAKEKQQFFAHKLEAFEKDRMAVVPLEKERFKFCFILFRMLLYIISINICKDFQKKNDLL